ncbi:MAG: hypothetical protein ACLFWI_12865, partial [Coleofasciculus sp.]|uniref:hypothetical protein n=1 Tax=Coleofasciculus sp. TaxID=3100458 RepID=UPI003A2A0C96
LLKQAIKNRVRFHVLLGLFSTGLTPDTVPPLTGKFSLMTVLTNQTEYVLFLLSFCIPFSGKVGNAHPTTTALS